MLVAKGPPSKGVTSSLSRKGMILASDLTVMELLMSSALVPQTVAVSDQIYSMVPPESLEMFLHQDRTDEGTYRREIHDCDDFALELMMSGRKASSALGATMALGAVMNFVRGDQGHALNVVLLSDLSVICVEPQSDAIFNCTEDDRGPTFILM